MGNGKNMGNSKGENWVSFYLIINYDMTSLEDAIENLSNINFSKFDGSEDEHFIKDFYINLLNKYKDIKNNWRKNGDRTYISGLFQKELLTTINKIAGKTDFAIHEVDIANKFLKESGDVKNIDLYIQGDEEKIAIEIKTILDFNPLGAAYLEALVTSENFNKFFVVSLNSTKEIYKKLKMIVENTELKKSITDVVVFAFYKKQEWFEEWVINFFKAIREAV